MNYAKFDQRMDFIKSLLKDKFCLQTDKLQPIEYDLDCQFAYNNFVYKVDVLIDDSISKQIPQSQQPGSKPLPRGVRELIIRLSNNVALGVNNTNRVENEVGSMQLARDALASSFPDLIPTVYGWASARDEKEQGWILMEFMSGVSLDSVFTDMNMPAKIGVLEQMVKIVNSFQQLTIPETITGLGGLTFNERGDPVNGKMTILPRGSSGPFPNFEELYRGVLMAQLEEADQSSVLNGWRSENMRTRLDRFIASGLSKVMGSSLDESRKILVHADLTTNNMLFDPESLQITAIIDFDFSHIAGLAEEFCRSFGNMSCQITGPLNGDSEQVALRNAFLNGFPDPLPESESADWAVASKWDEILKQVGAQRPATVPGLDAVSGIYWLAEELCPFQFTHPVVMKRFGQEELENMRKETQGKLDQYLESYGF